MPTQNLFGVPIVILSKVGNISIDLVEQVTIQHPSLVTENPTETGGNVSDHIVNLPTTISLAGRFVDAPFSVGGLDLGFNPLAGFAAAVNSGLTGGLSVQQWNNLENLRKSRALFDVVFQQGTYLDMAFRSLSGPRTKGDGTSQRFQAELQQVIVTGVNSLTAAFLSSEDVEHTTDESVDAGSQPTPEWGGL